MVGIDSELSAPVGVGVMVSINAPFGVSSSAGAGWEALCPNVDSLDPADCCHPLPLPLPLPLHWPRCVFDIACCVTLVFQRFQRQSRGLGEPRANKAEKKRCADSNASPAVQS